MPKGKEEDILLLSLQKRPLRGGRRGCSGQGSGGKFELEPLVPMGEWSDGPSNDVGEISLGPFDLPFRKDELHLRKESVQDAETEHHDRFLTGLLTCYVSSKDQ